MPSKKNMIIVGQENNQNGIQKPQNIMDFFDSITHSNTRFPLFQIYSINKKTKLSSGRKRRNKSDNNSSKGIWGNHPQRE